MANTIKFPRYRRLKGANATGIVTGDLTVEGTLTTGATVDGSAAVSLSDNLSVAGDLSVAGTSKDPLIATDASADKIAFFGATLASQQADPGALTVTDGTGTNDGTIDAITDNASTITAVQELAAKINAIRTVLRNIGICA